MIRIGKESDCVSLMEMYHDAQQYMKRNGIPQWQNGYPSEAMILQDIHNHEFYVVEEEGQVLAGCVILQKEEPTYAGINGAWKTLGPYTCLHRIVVKEECKGKGIALQLLEKAETLAKENHFLSVRADTHEENRSMRRFLEKNQFEYCGIITLANGDPRVAYEKRI